MNQLIKQEIDQLVPEMIKIRHHIHENPEIAGEEIFTANIVAEILKKCGYDVTTNVAGYGVVATFDSGNPGKTIALRVELDALPIQEENDLPYKSKVKGKMHACGHDGHIAVMLVVAEVLCKLKDSIKGKIKLIFQPAEEVDGMGAIELVKAGALENPKVDAIFGFHGTHRYPEGMLATKVGCLLAGNSTFEIKIIGKHGYVSAPHVTCNPITIGSKLIQELNNVNNTINPLEPSIISITQFHAGQSSNETPQEGFIQGSIRVIDSETQNKIITKIKTLIDLTAKFNECTISVNFTQNLHPVINTKEETELVLKSANNILGAENVLSNIDMIMAPEGFSAYLQQVPGCFFFIGNGANNGIAHKSDYNFNDNNISIIASIAIDIIINYLNI